MVITIVGVANCTDQLGGDCPITNRISRESWRWTPGGAGVSWGVRFFGVLSAPQLGGWRRVAQPGRPPERKVGFASHRMMILHAIWADGRLHLWGERAPKGDEEEGRARARSNDRIPSPRPSPWEGEGVGPSRRPSPREGEEVHGSSFDVSHDELRGTLGDVWDGLLVSGGVNAEVTLWLPHGGDRALSSQTALAYATETQSNPKASPSPRPSPWEGEGDAVQQVFRTSEQIAIKSVCVATLAFGAADAVDLLSTPPRRGDRAIEAGTSFRFWSRAAGLVLELLAGQRFVPAVRRLEGDRYVGFWRVVANEERTSERLQRLVAALPEVCRAAVVKCGMTDAFALVEDFLSSSIDALVRRSLAGDELTHAIVDASGPSMPLQTRWLQSLVGDDSEVRGGIEERLAIYRNVQGWLSRLEPAAVDRTCRLCLRLEAAEDDGSGVTDPPEPPLLQRGGQVGGPLWTLTLQMQSAGNRSLVVDASDLPEAGGVGPRILPQPFDNAREQLRADAATAARIFPALSVCAEPGGPTTCGLTMQEAYAFLRDAVPLLESEGVAVSLPKWWREDRPRLRMRLDLRPAEEGSGGGAPSMQLDALVSYDWKVALGDEDLSPEEITQLAMTKEPLVRVRGRWTEVQPSEVEAALRFMGQNARGRMRVFEALRQCYAADDLDTGLPVSGIRGFGWVERLLNATEWHAQVEDCEPPKGFLGELRPYQLRGVQWLDFLARLGLGACLADDMGLGKTIQLIGVLLHEREKRGATGPTLLVVPMSLVGNWRRELERFAPTLSVLVHHGLDRRSGQAFVDEAVGRDVVISTYALTHRDFEHLSAVQWHRIALDEAQNIKNPAAKQSAAVRSLRAVHRVALTGTPLENRLSELWSILNFLNPGYLGGAAEFRRRFAVPIERHHDANRASRLRDLIRPFVLRRLKSDPSVQVDLPAKMEMKVFCNLTKEQAALYEAIVGEMLGQIERTEGIQRRGLILATLTKLKQVCNHPVQFLGDGTELPHRSGKCDRLVEMLEEVLAEGDRALIFTQYRQMGHLLERLLFTAFDRKVLFLHGGTTQRERDALVERFQRATDDEPIFILSLKAGGFGLNLTAANHVFHFDRWWNPAVEDQATDRAHRIGQDRTVQVHKFVCLGTLEERIDALLAHKRSLADNIIGAGEEWITELSTLALRELFALSREAVGDE